MKQINTIDLEKSFTNNSNPLLDYAIRRMEREDQDKSSDNSVKDIKDLSSKLASCKDDLSKANTNNTSLSKKYNSMKEDYNKILSSYTKIYNELNILKESIKGLDIHFIIHNTSNNIGYYSDEAPTIKEITEPYNVIDFFLGNPMKRSSMSNDARMLGSYIDKEKSSPELSEYCNSESNKRMKFLCALMGIELPIDDKKWKGHEIN